MLLNGIITIYNSSLLMILIYIPVHIGRMSPLAFCTREAHAPATLADATDRRIGGMTNHLQPINGCAAWARFPGCACALIDIELCVG